MRENCRPSRFTHPETAAAAGAARPAEKGWYRSQAEANRHIRAQMQERMARQQEAPKADGRCALTRQPTSTCPCSFCEQDRTRAAAIRAHAQKQETLPGLLLDRYG